MKIDLSVEEVQEIRSALTEMESDIKNSLSLLTGTVFEIHEKKKLRKIQSILGKLNTFYGFGNILINGVPATVEDLKKLLSDTKAGKVRITSKNVDGVRMYDTLG